jgi:RNA polymerase sigma factor (sigma-70 family)
MASGEVVRQVGRLFEAGTLTGLTDGQLLDRFLIRRDDLAFEALIARHGPMVLGVCRAVLRDPAEADDAFQAAFLVLVRQAHSIRGRDGLGGWLYRTSYHIALRARASMARRRRLSPPPADPPADPAEDVLRTELRELVHAELNRLPESYRAAVVLCDIEGLTHDEAARRLQWPVGTVKGRLFRARELLRRRLTRRGVTVPAVLLGAGLATEARAEVAPALLSATVRAGQAVAAGTALGTGLVSLQVATLIKGALHMIWLKKLCVWTTLGLAMFGGAGVLAYQAREKPGPGPESSPTAVPAEKPPQSEIAGRWHVVEARRQGTSATATTFGPDIIITDDQIIITDDHFRGWWLKSRTGVIPYRFDPSRHEIDLELAAEGESKAATLPGLYQLDGDTLTICYRVEPGPRPSSLDTAKDTNWQVFVLKRGPGVEPRVDPTSGVAPPRNDLEAIQGYWSGHLWEGREDIDVLWRIDAEEIQAGSLDPGATRFRYRIDPETRPKSIDLYFTPRDGGTKFIRGIYRISKKYLEVCVSLDGGERPKDFLEQGGARKFLLELMQHRLGPNDPAPKDPSPPPWPKEPPTAVAESPKPGPGVAELDAEQAQLDLAEVELATEKKVLQDLLEASGKLEDERSRGERSTRLTRRPDDPSVVALKNRYAEDADRLRAATVETKALYVKKSQDLAAMRRQIDERKRKQETLTPGGEIKLAEPYRIKPGDRLVIEVLEALPGRPISGERIVRPDGTVSLGFYGDLPVAGLNRKEIKIKLIEHMQKYLKDEVLGLVADDADTGKPRAIAPADSDRVSVDESLNFETEPGTAPAGARTRGASDPQYEVRIRAIESKLDKILRRLDERAKP